MRVHLTPRAAARGRKAEEEVNARTLLELPDGRIGWVSTIYIQGGEKIAGVPDCAW